MILLHVVGKFMTFVLWKIGMRQNHPSSKDRLWLMPNELNWNFKDLFFSFSTSQPIQLCKFQYDMWCVAHVVEYNLIMARTPDLFEKGQHILRKIMMRTNLLFCQSWEFVSQHTPRCEPLDCVQSDASWHIAHAPWHGVVSTFLPAVLRPPSCWQRPGSSSFYLHHVTSQTRSRSCPPKTTW